MVRMDSTAWRKHKLLNFFQSIALLTAMGVLLSVLGWIVAGDVGIAWALGVGIALVLFYPAISPALVLQLYHARELSPPQAPGVFRILEALARRAELPSVPRLYYIPSSVINAFAVGTRASSAIAVSEGMFQALSERELCGVLAHEVSHIRHNDTWVMGMADLFSRLTAIFSLIGQMILLLYVPVALFSGLQINWLAMLILIFAPTLSVLLQLALSRAREFDADLGAAELSGDPAALASALGKIERYQGRFLEQIFFPGRRIPDPSILRTHPATRERVRRLRELQSEPLLPFRPSDQRLLIDLLRTERRRPRWHFPGTWY